MIKILNLIRGRPTPRPLVRFNHKKTIFTNYLTVNIYIWKIREIGHSEIAQCFLFALPYYYLYIIIIYLIFGMLVGTIKSAPTNALFPWGSAKTKLK